MNWHGTLTIHNVEEVAGMLRQLLEGKLYTSCEVYEYKGYRPELRLHQKLEPTHATNKEGISTYRHEDEDGNVLAGFLVVDSYGVWGLDTTKTDKGYDSTFNNPYLVFEWNKCTMTLRTPTGQLAYWMVVVEDEQ